MDPTFTVAVTVLVAVSITETLSLPEFATYTFVPSGVPITSQGSFPTFTLAVTVLFAVSITETLSLPLFVTYANDAALAILIIIKIIAVETKTIEYNFCLLII